VQRWPLPRDLPAQSQLIRLRIGQDGILYPRQGHDLYGWSWREGAFRDHLALLASHELSHLWWPLLHGPHRQDDEHAANRWALAHATSRGFSVAVDSPAPARYAGAGGQGAHRGVAGRTVQQKSHLSPPVTPQSHATLKTTPNISHPQRAF